MTGYDTLDQRRKDVSLLAHRDEQTWCFALGVSIQLTSATVPSNTILDAYESFPHNLVQRIQHIWLMYQIY